MTTETKQRVLILTVKAGSGHNNCARSMQERLTRVGTESRIVDLLAECSTPLNVWTADKGYGIAVGVPFLRPMYDRFFRHYGQLPAWRRFSSAVRGVPMSAVAKLYRLINEYRPDVIYCTHFYAAVAITFLKQAYPIYARTLGVVLDYECSPFWESAIGIDALGIPSEDFFSVFEGRGFARGQLLPVGIPVRDAFYDAATREEACGKLGFERNVFTVLVMFGGGNWGGCYGMFRKLERAMKGRPHRVIVINGHNKLSKRRVARYARRAPENVEVVNLGYTKEVSLYMSASDVAVTKTGGVSSTEMVMVGLPVFGMRRIAAQERDNLDYLERKGCARSYGTLRELTALCDACFDGRGVLASMRGAEAELARDAQTALTQYVTEAASAEYDEEYLAAVDYRKVKKTVARALRAADRKERAAAKAKRR